MPVSSRSSANALSDLLAVLSDPQAAKAKLDALTKATQRHDKAKSDADAALSELDEARTEHSKQWSEISKATDALHRDQTEFSSHKAAWEEKINEASKLTASERADLAAERQAYTIYADATTNELDERQAFIHQREAELAQAQRALDVRAAKLAEDEKAVAAAKSDLEHRLGELRRLAG